MTCPPKARHGSRRSVGTGKLAFGVGRSWARRLDWRSPRLERACSRGPAWDAPFRPGLYVRAVDVCTAEALHVPSNSARAQPSVHRIWQSSSCIQERLVALASTPHFVRRALATASSSVRYPVRGLEAGTSAGYSPECHLPLCCFRPHVRGADIEEWHAYHLCTQPGR